MIIPNVLKCGYFKMEGYDNNNKRTVLDYEIDYYLSGGRTVYVDGKKFTIQPNCLIFKKPGQQVSGYGSSDCYMLTLDFSHTKKSEEYKRNNPGKLQSIYNNNLISQIPTFLEPIHAEEIKNLLKTLSIYNESIKKENFLAVIMELLCLISADSFNSITEKNTTNDDLTYICRYMQKNFSEKIIINDLAEKIHLDTSYFIRKFKKTFKISPLQYLSNIRLNNAKLLLKNTDYSINSISEMCGFCNSSYFSKYFRQELGITPKEYRSIDNQN